jgi:phage baseplate assembly protein W
MEYLALPLQLHNDYLARAEDIGESILYSVGFLLSTRPGGLDFLPDFGCSVWDMEYTDVNTAHKSDVRSSLRNAIGKFETRLFNVSVSFSASDQSGSRPLGLKVKVTGDYLEDEEEKRFEGTYQLG